MKRILLIATLFAVALSSPSFGAIVNPAIPAGAVYAMTNNTQVNAVAVYNRDINGSLTYDNIYETGGRGGFAGDPVDALGSEGALVLSQDRSWLYAVNAGSNQISVFRVLPRGLALIQIIDSGGDFPVSITQYQNLLYVLNSGGEGNITGFSIAPSGRLSPIPGSTRVLNAGGSTPPFFVESPAQVSFDPTGHWLVVTIKKFNQIDLFAVGETGIPADQPVINDSLGSTPFGFGFNNTGHLIVAEPFGSDSPGIEFAGAVSSYSIANDGTLIPVSAIVKNNQTATCWIAIGPRGHFAYATNNGSSTITGYRVQADGSLELLDANGITALSNSRPIDMGVTSNGDYLYSLNAGTGTIATYQIDASTGALTFIGEALGLPEENGIAGLAVR